MPSLLDVLPVMDVHTLAENRVLRLLLRPDYDISLTLCCWLSLESLLYMSSYVWLLISGVPLSQTPPRYCLAQVP